MAVPKTPGERTPGQQGPRSIEDLLGSIREIPQQRVAYAREQAMEKAKEEQRQLEQRRNNQRDRLLKAAHKAYPSSIWIENFVVPRDNTGYPTVKVEMNIQSIACSIRDQGLGFSKDVDIIAREMLVHDKEQTVVLTNETTNIPEMVKAIEQLKKGHLGLGVEWDFKVDDDGTRITSARVNRLYRCEYEKSKDFRTLDELEHQVTRVHVNEWNRRSMGKGADKYWAEYHKVLYSRDGDLKDMAILRLYTDTEA